MSKAFLKYSLAGLLVLVPAWVTFLILSTLFHTLNELIHGLPWNIGARQSPGLSLVLFLLLVVVCLAALNLLLDFDMIEKGAEKRVPKFMEWYCGAGLLFTLVWLYLEILRLLSKLTDR